MMMMSGNASAEKNDMAHIIYLEDDSVHGIHVDGFNDTCISVTLYPKDLREFDYNTPIPVKVDGVIKDYVMITKPFPKYLPSYELCIPTGIHYHKISFGYESTTIWLQENIGPIGAIYNETTDTWTMWNNENVYYINATSGRHYSNVHGEFWSFNDLCYRYVIDPNIDEEGCLDDVEWTWSNSSDNATYANLTGQAEKAGYTFNLTFHLEPDWKSVRIRPELDVTGVKALDDSWFIWKTTEINIDGDEENDWISINNSLYDLNVTNTEFNATRHYNNSEPVSGFNHYRMFDNVTKKFLSMRWNDNKTVDSVTSLIDDVNATIYSESGQRNSPVSVRFHIGGLDKGDTARLTLYWIDAIEAFSEDFGVASYDESAWTDDSSAFIGEEGWSSEFIGATTAYLEKTNTIDLSGAVSGNVTALMYLDPPVDASEGCCIELYDGSSWYGLTLNDNQIGCADGDQDAEGEWITVYRELNDTFFVADFNIRFYCYTGSVPEEVWIDDVYVTYMPDSDSTPPTYSGAAHNTTVAGAGVKFSIEYNDNIALNPNGGYIFSTNNTGTWTNDSFVNWTSTPETSEVIKTLNDSVGVIVGYMWYANDSYGNINNSEIYTLTTISSDLVAPGITIDSPENTTYSTSIVNLNTTLNESAEACIYNLDGNANTSMLGSGTNWHIEMTPSAGTHQLNVYCNDSVGNMGENRSVWFTKTAITCGETITSDTTMTSDVFCPAGDGIIFGAHNIKLDCAGYTLSNNNASTGIDTDSYDNLTITDCNVEYFNRQIEIAGTNITLYNTSVISFQEIGVYLVNAYDGNVTELYAYSDSNFALRIGTSDRNEFTDIETESVSYDTIRLSSSEDNIFNGITSTSGTDQAIEVATSSNGNNFTDFAATSGVSAIFISSSNMNTFRDGTATSDESAAAGVIDLDGSSYTTIENVTVTTTTSGFGMNFDSSTNFVNVSGCTVSTHSVGINLGGSDNGNIEDSTITSSEDVGLRVINPATSNNVTNNMVTSDTSNALWFFLNPYNNDFEGNTFYAPSGIAVYVQDTHDNTFNNTNATGVTGVSFQEAYNVNFTNAEITGSTIDITTTADSGTYDNWFINCTYDEDEVTVSGSSNNLTFAQYIRANVTDGTSGLLGATVTAYDAYDSQVFSETTDSNGLTPYVVGIEYFQNESTSYYYTNYTANATLAGYENASETWNITVEQTIDIVMVVESPAYCWIVNVAEVYVPSGCVFETEGDFP